MDDTAGGATPCAWTSTNLCTYSALIIAETAGVTVSQGGVDKGTLKTTLTGVATSVTIQTASGVTILANADITIGSTVLAVANIDSATNSVSNVGTLKTTTGADTTNVIIT